MPICLSDFSSAKLESSAPTYGRACHAMPQHRLMRPPLLHKESRKSAPDAGDAASMSRHVSMLSSRSDADAAFRRHARQGRAYFTLDAAQGSLAALPRPYTSCCRRRPRRHRQLISSAGRAPFRLLSLSHSYRCHASYFATAARRRALARRR